MNGNSDVVEWLLNKAEMKTKVNSLDGGDMPALFLACMKGYVGTDGVGSRTGLIYARRLEIVRLLVEKGADIDYTRTVVRLTALHWAAYHDDADVVRFLLSKGAK